VKKQISKPGRTIQKKAKRPMPVAGLKIGMYVAELDRPWLETPFLLQGFRIECLEDIDTIAGYCEYVYIEEQEDEWLKAEERSILEQPSPKKIYPQNALNKQSFSVAKSTQSNARQLTRTFMDDVRLGRGIDMKEVKTTVSECVKSIMHNPDALLWVGKIRDRDEYTAEHSLNVGILAMTFGRHLGADEEELNVLGLCGILHDVGKMKTPLEVLNKEGRLTAEEFQIMKKHPVDGRDILINHKDAHHSAVDVCYSHHEALDGSGYPRGLTANNISDITRMVTICDVYDAITSERIYKKGQSSLEALKVLYQNRDTKFDNRLVTEFIECIGLYPPGSIVELKNGEIGIVISTNYRHRHLPKVLIVRGSNKMPTKENVINLEKKSGTENNEYIINSVVSNGTHGIRIEKYIKKGLTID
jgi:putative nucleotidyltransferase with HDIG domain